jgi:hypothetical protein
MRKEDRGQVQPTKVYLAYLVGGPQDGAYVKVEEPPHVDPFRVKGVTGGEYRYWDTRSHTYRYQWTPS